LVDKRFVGEVLMKCHHCNGIMTHERFSGPGEPFWGWRCVFCREIFDSLILENRNHCGKITMGEKGASQMGGRRGGEPL